MHRIFIILIAALCSALLLFPTFAYAVNENTTSIITATGQDVPTDDHLDEEYRFPAKYRDNAVQFRTEDGVLLCGYVLGEGSRGITLGHPNGWMVKSWLPFAERLVDAGYMVILWEFRNIEPSGFAPESESRRWDLDVLAAAQVLREKGAKQILAMGASDGGTATAIAAPDIPELAGLGILSSPKDSIGDAVSAMARVKDVPAFFAVSTNDSSGNFYPHVEALYEACTSTQKQFNVIEGFDHGTDMITPVVPGLGYASMPVDEAQVQKRQELSDKLLLFANDVFAVNNDQLPAGDDTEETSPKPIDSETNKPVAEPISETSERNSASSILPWLIAGLGILIGLAVGIVFAMLRRRKH